MGRHQHLACILAMLVSLLAGCGADRYARVLGQDSFEAYREDTVRHVAANRDFQSRDHIWELAWNAPQEWRPEGAPRKGILLVHGLGDSPWSFCDIGPVLARRGFLVRTVLLPGCGTKPPDMIGANAAHWRRVVAEQAAVLRREVDEVYLGGFSTGANLVLEYAYAHPEVSGLVLFSPGFKSDQPYDFLAPLAALFTDWLIKPDGSRPVQDVMRYAIVPANALGQFYRTSASARSLLHEAHFDRPALLVLSEHDSVLDTRAILGFFETKFTHPASRLIWYGSLEGHSPRVLVRPDALPEWRISSFSHMGVLFSPDNPEYGREGRLRICWNGQAPGNYERCLEGGEVWYSAWGHREEGKIHARLTFNPYFAWQAGVMLEVLGANGGMIP